MLNIYVVHQVPTVGEMVDMWKKKHNTFGILYSWFLAKVYTIVHFSVYMWLFRILYNWLLAKVYMFVHFSVYMWLLRFPFSVK